MSAVLINPEASTFEEFHTRHRDKNTGKRLAWMADFYRAKEGLMYHREAPLEWRVLELGKCRSWGNGNRDYIAQDDGHPMTQRQIGNILGVSYKRVCEAVDWLVREGYFGRKGQIIFVLDDPARARAEQEGRTNSKDKSPTGGISAKEKAKFFKAWAEHSPEQYKQFQQLGKEIQEKFDQQRQMQEAAWEWYEEEQKKSGTGRTSSSEDPERDGQNVRNGADDLSGAERTEGDFILNGFTYYLSQLASYKEGEFEKLIENTVSALQQIEKSNLRHLTGARVRAIRVTAGRLAQLAAKRRGPVFQVFIKDLTEIATRKENKPQSWGILVAAMDDAIDEARGTQPSGAVADVHQDEPLPTVEEQIESLEGRLDALPNHPQADSWRDQLAALKRKPAASEGGEHAQRAGAR